MHQLHFLLCQADSEKEAKRKALEKTGDIGKEELRIESTNFEVESIEETHV